MDSITQLTLGAAVGEATLGKKVGTRALVWGGVCGTIPDLDILIPFQDPIQAFVSHRSFSHSLFILALATPAIVWVIRRFHPDTVSYTKRWLMLVYLAFATHVLLDCFTAYGTQIFWPLSRTPLMWSTIFIVDPLYTLPLVLGVTSALVLSRGKRWGNTLNSAGLILSTLYLSWTVVAKTHVETFVKDQLAQQQVSYSQLLIQPTPINTLLWRILVMQDEGYAEGFYSLLRKKEDIRLTRYPNPVHLLNPLATHKPIQNLQRFSQGFWGVRQVGDFIVLSDLRMGMEPHYAFSFNVGKRSRAEVEPIPSEGRLPTMNWGTVLPWVWSRIWEAP